MATLHVRNVPDELYELLRERAKANDRSIGAETVQLLRERLAFGGVAAVQPKRFPVPRRRRPAGTAPFSRFTEDARRVVVDAQEQARGLGHDHVRTEHLLLAVVGRPGPAAEALAELGLGRERGRAEVERLAARGSAAPEGEIPFGPDAKQAFELALREALKLHDELIAPEHVLLGILAQETGAGAQTVRAVAADTAELSARLRARSRRDPFASAAVQPFRVVELEGDAETWEARLNDAAASGYELVEIVDRRAVLRRT